MADDLKLKLQIGGDGSGAVAAVDGVEKSLGGMGSTSEKVNAQLKAMAAAAEGVEVPAAAVDSVGKLKTEAAGAAKGIGDLAAKEAQLASETDSARAKVDQLHASLVNTAAAEKTLAAGANSVNSAFSALNLRSADKIRADILAVDQALVKLSSNSKVSGAEFDRAWAAGQAQLVKLRGELSGLPVEPVTQSVGGLTGAFSSLQGVLGALGLGALGQKFLDANLAADKLQKSLNAVNGDAGKTASDLNFLKETAQRLGINLESSSAGFVKLAAAAKGTALEGKATRDIFSNLGGAMAQLGLSSAETERAFVAIAQMMSKGTVNAEELKGQLGDVLPGAMAVAARATGLTTQELGKLMETGGLIAEDFLPKFAAEVKKSFGGAEGDVQGLSNTIERVKNTWSQAFKAFGDNGALAALGGAVGVLNEGLLILATGLTTVVSGFFAFVKAVAVTVAAVTTMDFSNLTGALKEIGAELVGNIDKMARLTGTAKFVGEAVAGTAVATRQAAAASNAAGAGWEKLNVAYSQSAKLAADYVDQMKKVKTANDEQGNVLVKLATLSGNENDLYRVKQEVAEKAAESSANLARALDVEAKTLQAKAIALQEETKGQKQVSDEKIKAIEEAKQAATAKGEEARAALASADASRVAAAAAQVESLARADNSKRVVELKDAYEQAALKVEVLKKAQEAGVSVNADLTAAQTAAAKASALYKDALSDQTRAIEYNAAIKAKESDLKGAGLKLDIAQLETMAQVARAYGDEATAAYYLLEAKRLEIELAELTAKAKRAEAEAALLVIKAKRAELQASGEFTAAKQAELRAQELGAQVKLKEADIADETADRMRRLTDATAGGATAAENAAGSYDKLAGSLDGVANSADRAASAQDGVRNASGTALGKIGGSSQADFTQTLYQRGATIEEQKLAQKYVGELYQRNQATMLTGNLGNEDNAARLQKMAINDAVDKAIAAARKELATGQAVNLGTSVGDLIARNESKTPLKSLDDMISRIKNAGNESKAQTIRVDLRTDRGRSAVNVASPQDASTLISTLKDLQGRAA